MTDLIKKQADITTDIFGSTLTVTFANGKSLEVNVADMPAAMQLQAAIHGMKQKLVDAAAIGRNTDTGRSANIDDKFAAVQEVYDRVVTQGMWNKIRGDGGSSKGSKSFLCEALMELYKKDRAVITVWMKEKTKEELAALKANYKVADIIRRMEAEKASSVDVDTDSMLDELDGL
jgi:hypothetical protein